jgi:hypothetical protein
MKEKSCENQSELKRDVVVKLKLDVSVSQNAKAEEHLDGENENGFPENIELIGLGHVVLLLVHFHECEVWETVNASSDFEDLALLNALIILQW